MLRYIPARTLSGFPRLADSMFRDRAAQFADRLGWPVQVGPDGGERDEYDALEPVYVVWERCDGRHGGSMRFLPTTGRTMVDEHFADLVQGVRIKSPFIWECTRFCLAPDAGARIAPALMLGGLELGLRRGLSHAIGVFDARMIRVYRRLGWPAAPLGQRGDGPEAIMAGMWDFDPAHRAALLRRAGISAELSDHWWRRSMDPAAHLSEAG